ncbi:serine/threonine-protein kinase [Pyxidicoccus trucidator]|uniref:serine/threonine-protein kinase n=1 Tax=Pyxidicoccus trucidator TaxID=2709662 RepID=UPI0013DBAB98|nr:serine/threonine-protein kinase [Pyxidicoccus trucidator]
MSGNRLPLAPDARSLGKYEVLSRLSTGGMAEIFLASQRGLAGFRKLVVLKQILPDIRGEEEFVRMFLDEAKVTAAFNHPHIAQVYDLDIADGELFLSMEFVPGATLVEVARACRLANIPIPMGYSLMAVRDTAVALHYAHTFTDPLGHPSPVIHRDVAEKNIMVTYEGVTKLLDFGIAKSLARASRTAVGMVKGTSGYMSPEQILGEPLDARSDLFSLGVVLHECLTGMRLFYAKQADAMMTAVLRCEVTPPSRTNKQVPPELDAIVMRALSRKREDRYATTLEFARALERAVGPHIWHPEQSSELMRRLFADRREQTRQLLMSGQAAAGDNTGEMSVARMLAMGAESSEQPTGGAGVAQAAPPPNRPSVSLPSLKAPVLGKPPSPPQGAPAPRRPTVNTPAAPPPSAADEANARKVLTPPPQKRVPPRTTSGETTRPPPPPAEAMASPHKPEHSLARTQPGVPALPPEPTSSSGEPPRAERRAGRSTLEGMRAVAPSEAPARSGRTLDNLRITAPIPPPPAADEAQTAMVRAPVLPVERDLQTAMVRPPAPPVERDLQTAMARPPAPPVERDVQPAMARPPAPPVERDVQPAMARPPAPPVERDVQPAARSGAFAERDVQLAARSGAPAQHEVQTAMVRALPHAEREGPSTIRQAAPPPERREETVSITPAHTPRRRGTNRRRQSLPPPPFPEVTTEPVPAYDPHQDEDSEGAALGDDDAHENTQKGIRSPRREQRSRAWVAVAAVLVLLGAGAVTVILGLDGGRVSAWVKPLLGMGPKDGTQTPPATARGNPPAEPGTPGAKPAPAPGTDTPGAAARAGTGGTDTPGTGPGAVGTVDPMTAVDTAPTDSPREPEAGDVEAAPPEPPEDSVGALDNTATSRKPKVPKRTREAPARKPRATEEPPATATPQAGSEAGSETAPAGEPGFLTLVTEPYAKVFLGSRELGDTPLFKVKLPSGKHTLKLVDGNGKALRLPVDIKAGETTAVRIPLEMLSRQ